MQSREYPTISTLTPTNVVFFRRLGGSILDGWIIMY
eukprot:COSAG02_NODE_7400_length_3034_cov_16.453152_3_plen_35_part_01